MQKYTRFKKKYKEESNEIIYLECKKPGQMKVWVSLVKEKETLWWQEKENFDGRLGWLKQWKE